MPKESIDWRAILLAATLPTLLVLITLDSVWTNLDNYDPIFRTNTFDYSSAVRTTEQLISYFKGPVDQPLTVSAFSPKEASHLRDVKQAFKRAGLLFGIVFFVWVASFIQNPLLASRALFLGGSACLLLCAMMILVPFDALFTLFHALLFKPETWIFSPNELLVSIYPKSLFEHLAEIIFWRTAALAVLSAGLGFSLKKCLSKNLYKN